MSGLVQDIAKAGPEEIQGRYAYLTDQTALATYHWLKAADVAVELVRKALRTYVQLAGPVPLGDGRVYGPQRVHRETLDGRIVQEVVREIYGAQAAAEAVEITATKAALERLAEREAARSGEKKTHLVRYMLSVIDERGGLRSSEREEIRVHKIKEAP
jgi:hypothetical protein